MLRALWTTLTLLSTISLANPVCKYVNAVDEPTVGRLTLVTLDSVKNVCFTQTGYAALVNADSTERTTLRRALSDCDTARKAWEGLAKGQDSLSAAMKTTIGLQSENLRVKDSTIAALDLALATTDSVVVVKDQIIKNREGVIKACEDSKMTLMETVGWISLTFLLGGVLGLSVGAAAF